MNSELMATSAAPWAAWTVRSKLPKATLPRAAANPPIGGLAAARGSVAFGNFDLTVQAAQGAADVAMSSEFTGYTWYALLFEATFAVLAGLCLLNKDNQN